MDYMKYITIQVIKKSERSEVVFAAMDELDVPVVVKRLRGANPEIYRGIAKLRNLHIPRIYCVEEQGEELCVAEEYIDGRTLEVYLAEETLADVQKLELCVQLCEALEVLHQCKPPVIHRDIKPSNILITGDGVLKVIDFDASRQYKTEKNTSDTRLLGTIEYAAPEQFGYAQTDVRSDIYSVGVVFSEIAIDKTVAFAKDWKRLVDKCTSFDPENRYKSVTKLKKDLLKCMDKAKSPLWKRLAVPAVATGVLLVMLVAGGIQQHREKERAVLEQVTKEEGQPSEETKSTGQPDEDREPAQQPTNKVTTTVQPTSTSRPTGTLKPTSTPKPTSVTENWEIPQQRPASVGENGVVRKRKTLKGERTELVGYNMKKMGYKESNGLSYRLTDGGSVKLKFDKIYGKITYELQDVIDMKYCDEIAVHMKNEVGDIAIVLFDEDYMPVETLYQEKTEETGEMRFFPKYNGRVEYISFMANDGMLEDYSEFETVINYVDFYVVNPESPKISYQMSELTEEKYYYMERTYNENGSIFMDFERIYGEVMLTLPEPVDMRYCNGISLVMDSKSELGLKLYDENFEEIEAFYDRKTEGVEERLYDPGSGIKVYGIGLMANDSEVTDYTVCNATVYEVNFYMQKGHVGE